VSHIWNKYDYNIDMKLLNFEKFINKETMARFMARYELFKLIRGVKGSIIECGVHYGGGVMAWAKLSTLLEPYAIRRKIIGFDTFEGFPEINNKDLESEGNTDLEAGRFFSHNYIYDELVECIDMYDKNRYLDSMYLNSKDKVELVKGDARVTIPEYISRNNHLVVSMLFLDFDLYEPTKVALENLVKRIPKGGVIVFDEINNELWKGDYRRSGIFRVVQQSGNKEIRF